MNGISKLDSTSRVLVIVSLFGIVGSLMGWLFISNRQILNEDGGEPVANVTFHKNDTRVKRAHDIHWNPLTDTIDCYRDDRIFTGADSEATVKFPGGVELKLHPNSLILLSKDMVELDSGTLDINITGDEGIAVKSFGEKIEAKSGAKIRLVNSKTTKKFIPLNPAAKNISLTTFLKTIKVEPDSPVAPNAEVEIVVPKVLPLAIKMPESSLDFNEAPGFTAELDDPNSSEEYEYVIKNEKAVLKEGKTTTQQIVIGQLPDGAYTLSVAAKIRGKVINEALMPFTVQMRSLNPPTVLGSYRFFADELTDVPLEWSGPLNTEYEVEITDNKKQQVLYHSRVKDMGINYRPPKGPGNYFFRVRYQSKSGLNMSPFSDHSEIEVQDKVTLIRRPLMARPKDENVELNQGKLRFTWEEPDPTLTYSLELFREGNGKPFKVLKVTGGKLVHKLEQQKGTYWWRIVATSNYGNTTPDKAMYRFTVSVPEAKKPEPKKPEPKRPEPKKPEPKKPGPERPATDKRPKGGIDFIQLRGRKRVQDSEW